MFPKRFLRILMLAVITTAVYFLFIQNHRTERRPASRSHGYGEAHEHRRNEPDRKESRRDRGEFGNRSSQQDDLPGIACQSTYFAAWQEPAQGACRVRMRNGYPLPDPRCTPGGANPSLSADVLRDPGWRTRSVRNCESSEAQKHVAYKWYGVEKPRINSNQNQVCELDHLVPLELGGADGLGNIWPECGPDSVILNERYFKRKDRVENYLAEEVRLGRMDLISAQHGIATDWTQYLDAADQWCAGGLHC